MLGLKLNHVSKRGPWRVKALPESPFCFITKTNSTGLIYPSRHTVLHHLSAVPHSQDKDIVRPNTTWTLQWRHNEREGVLNHRCLDCLLNRLFRRRSKKTQKLRYTGICDWNPPVTNGFLSQRASNAENVSIWWHHYIKDATTHSCFSPLNTVRFPGNYIKMTLKLKLILPLAWSFIGVNHAHLFLPISFHEIVIRLA